MGDDRAVVDGDAVDPDELAVVSAAIKKTVSGFTYMGISVGMYVTDDECRQVATDALIAINNFRKAPSI